MKNMNPLSTATLILGCLALIPLFGFLTGLAAIVIGIISLKQIKQSNQKGKEFSQAGIVVAVIGIAIWGTVYSFMAYQVSNSLGSGAFDSIKEEGTKTGLHTTLGLLEYHKKINKTYPNSLEDLNGAIPTITQDYYGNSYHYQLTTDSFELKSLGKDGVLDTEDDIYP